MLSREMFYGHTCGPFQGLKFLCLLFMFITTSNGVNESNLKIGAFNMQIFGVTKISKPDVVDIIVKIIRRYDVILLQEIRDSTETAINQMLAKVNRAGLEQYGMTISERLGRTSSKEQYAFFYRLGVDIVVRDTYQYPDPGDVFEREPYCVLFHASNTEVKEFVLVAIHASPGDAVSEINALKAVYEAVQKKWKNKNVLILGDFNADCSYVSRRAMKTLSLMDSTFHWWITDEVDTTVTNSDCTYDRFVMTGKDFIADVVQNSAKVFPFDAAYGLSLDEARKVSDHYPIEIFLKSRPVLSVPSRAAHTGGIVQNAVRILRSLMCFLPLRL